MNNISAELVVLIAMFLSMLAFFMNLTKRVDNISKELTDFKNETRKELSDFKTEVRVELVRMQARFDKYDGVNTDLEKRVAEIQAQVVQTKEQAVANQNQTNEKLLQMETDNKNYMKELTNKVIEILPKSAL